MSDNVRPEIYRSKIRTAEAVREKGFGELVDGTLPTNIGMLKLFKKLPYRAETAIEDNTVIRSGSFEK